MALFVPSIMVSLLGITVIFIVLSTLIGLIKLMDRLWPYQEPAVPPAAGGSEEEEHTAIIHSVLAHHLGKAPTDIRITSIKPL